MKEMGGMSYSALLRVRGSYHSCYLRLDVLQEKSAEPLQPSLNVI